MSSSFVTYGTACVSAYDYRTLEEGEYLNDAVVDFYLQWLHNNVLPEKNKEEVHIFSSHFYTKLTR